MKQKRKVKSLIPQKNDLWGSLLTAALLVLGVALCLWSATLMTSSVWAASTSNEYNEFPYSWMDDRVEVLYNLQFSDPKILSGFVGEMYTDKNNDFYITSTPITVNDSGAKDEYKNEVDKNKKIYSNILWWHGNKVHSENVTILWWSGNIVDEDSAVIFWWIENEISWGTVWNTEVIVWWKKNLIIGSHNWNAIIWWNNNIISWNVSNSFILWWNSNDVSSDKQMDNVIVWGSNVKVHTWNVFVFSNEAFEPENPNTFYLNVSNWLWINVKSAGKWVTVNGPVRFGELDITKYSCNGDNYWVIWTWYVNGYGCLVWCTSTTAPQWDLLDRWENCQLACKDNPSNCSQKMPQVDKPGAYSGFCTDGVDTSNASPCTPVWDEVKNVVFETALVNSKEYKGECPGADAVNKCVYQCNSGYYLTGDQTWRFSGKTKCYQVCNVTELLKRPDWTSDWHGEDWKDLIIQHNTTITAYNKEVVPCSYNERVPKLATSRDSVFGDWYYLDDGYGTKMNIRWIGLDNAGIPGSFYRYKLPEHCANNAHKQTLVCSDWKLYIVKKDTNNQAESKLATDWWYFNDKYLWYDHNWYLYKECKTEQYRCDISEWKYDLTKTYIQSRLELWDPVSWTTEDRSKMNWTRWKYQLCIDYDTVAGKNDACKPLQTGTPDKHYKFLWCQKNYKQSNQRSYPLDRSGDDPRLCRHQCYKKTRDNGEMRVDDNTTITLYKQNEGKCTSVPQTYCEPHTFVCDDWKWKNDWYNIDDYDFYSCTEKWFGCDWYNISESVANDHLDTTYYLPCHKWYANSPKIDQKYTNGDPSSIAQCSDEHVYKLDYCKVCNHVNTTDQKYCVDDFLDWSACSAPSNWTAVGRNYRLWNGSSMVKHDECWFYCNADYYKYGNKCYSNKDYYCKEPTWLGSWENYILTWETDIPNGYTKRFEVLNSSGDHVRWWDTCYYCDSDAHQEWSSCVENNFGCLWATPDNSSPVTYTDGSDKTAVWHNYRWDPNENCAFVCDYGYYWNGTTCMPKKCLECSRQVYYDAWEWDVAWSSDITDCGGDVTLPSATWDCHTFLWWEDVNGTLVWYAWWKFQPLWDSVTLYARWSSRDTTSPNCKYKCTWTEPSYQNMEWNGESNWENVEWKPIDIYWVNLSRCEWRCKVWYERSWNTCKEIECKAGDLPSDKTWILTGDSTYVWVDLNDKNRKWSRVSEWDLQPCQWRCNTEGGYEWNSTKKICEKVVEAWCAPDATNPKHYQCTEGSNPAGTGAIKLWWKEIWWKWNCEWTNNRKVSCLECEVWYKKTSTSCEEYKCKTPKPSWLTWPETYTGVGVTDWREWAYMTGVALEKLWPCEWSCPSGKERSWNSCIDTLTWKCGADRYHKCDVWTADPKSSDERKRMFESKVAWWEWVCKWTPLWADSELCVQCNTDLGFTLDPVTKQCKPPFCENEATKKQTCESGGWTWNSDDCACYNCTWPQPENSVLVQWSDKDLKQDTPRQLYSSTTAAWNSKCAYVCDSTHKYIDGECKEQEKVACDETVLWWCSGCDHDKSSEKTFNNRYEWSCRWPINVADCVMCRNEYKQNCEASGWEMNDQCGCDCPDWETPGDDGYCPEEELSCREDEIRIPYKDWLVYQDKWYQCTCSDEICCCERPWFWDCTVGWEWNDNSCRPLNPEIGWTLCDNLWETRFNHVCDGYVDDYGEHPQQSWNENCICRSRFN